MNHTTHTDYNSIEKAVLLYSESARRSSWPECRIIRQPSLADNDFFMGETNLEGTIIDDCKERTCDCRVAIYVPTEDDKKALDWEIIKV